MSAILSFLGGSVFRAIWGEAASYFTKKQDNAHELEMLKVQAELDDAAHKRSMEALNTQAALGVKTIEAQASAAVDTEEAKAFTEAMTQAFKPTGYAFVDIWNGIIRPAAATLALFLWFNALYNHNFAMTDWDKELVGVILGFWFASRVLSRAK